VRGQDDASAATGLLIGMPAPDHGRAGLDAETRAEAVAQSLLVAVAKPTIETATGIASPSPSTSRSPLEAKMSK
jgi:hypothetical protein